jgi:hypothetical protein
MFQITPNTENYQARYVITHPATGDFSCDAGKKYLKELKQRRADEMEMLTYLTGKGYSDWDVVTTEEDKYIPSEASYTSAISLVNKKPKRDKVVLFATLSIMGLVSIIGFRQKRYS